MNIGIINLSPRKQGTSAMLCDFIHQHCTDNTQLYHYLTLLNQKNEIHMIREKYDTLVFVGPDYITTYPADTLLLFEQLEQSQCMKGKKVYGIIQGGMPTPHTHKHGLMSLELFAQQSKAAYMGGFVMGLGAMLNGLPIENLPNGKKVKGQFLQFIECIHHQEYAPDALYEKAELKLPVFILKFLASAMNRKIINDLKAHQIDYKTESPYRRMLNENKK